MSKTLCELKKELRRDFDSYVLLICRPRFVCKDCGRAANKKKYLCNPVKIEGRAVEQPGADGSRQMREEVMAVDKLSAES